MDKYDQLQKLAELKSYGALTEEEFTAQKAKLLATDYTIVNPSMTQPLLSREKVQGSYWLPISSFAVGSLAFCMLIAPGEWDKDMVGGLIFFSVISAALGIISLSVQCKGRGMAIAGIVLGIICILGALGMEPK